MIGSPIIESVISHFAVPLATFRSPRGVLGMNVCNHLTGGALCTGLTAYISGRLGEGGGSAVLMASVFAGAGAFPIVAYFG